jgi:hypothetical protein
VGIELGAEASHVVTDIQSASRPQDIRIRGHACDPRGGVEAGDVRTVPLASQLGHGSTASIRRQPVRIVKDPSKGSDATLRATARSGGSLNATPADIPLAQLRRMRGISGN